MIRPANNSVREAIGQPLDRSSIPARSNLNESRTPIRCGFAFAEANLLSDLEQLAAQGASQAKDSGSKHDQSLRFGNWPAVDRESKVRPDWTAAAEIALPPYLIAYVIRTCRPAPLRGKAKSGTTEAQ